MIPSKRIPEIDIAKLIGISIVILQHAEYPMDHIFTFLTVFAMPLFFILSGAFQRGPGDYSELAVSKDPSLGSFASFAKSRFRRLAIPYLYFSGIYLIVRIAIGLVRYHEFPSITIKNELLRFFTLHGISVLWFLSALLMSSLLFSLLLRAGKKLHLLCCLILVLLLVLTAFAHDPLSDWYDSTVIVGGLTGLRTEILYDLALTVLRIPVCIFFLALGNSAYRLYDRCFCRINSGSGIPAWHVGWERTPKMLKAFLLLLLSVAFYALTFFLAVYNSGGNIPLIYYGNNLALYLLAASLGSLATMLFAKSLVFFCETLKMSAVIHALTFLGANSLIIMLTHMDLHLISIARIPLFPLLFLPEAVLGPAVALYYILTVVFTLLIEVPVILLIRRYAAFLLGERIGKKTDRH